MQFLFLRCIALVLLTRLVFQPLVSIEPFATHRTPVSASFAPGEKRSISIRPSIKNPSCLSLSRDSVHQNDLNPKCFLTSIFDFFKPKAYVRVGQSLCTDEEAFVNERLTYANTALSSLLGMQIPLAQTPRIAICGSGGGFRSMISLLGALTAFDTIGLTDTFLYSAGVSGSTWSLGAWYMYGPKPSDAVAAVRNQATYQLWDGFDPAPVIDRSLEGLIYQQKIGVVGMYGALLGNRLFNQFPNRYSVVLSDFASKISEGLMPMPIFTAVIPPDPSTTLPYLWCEMTPFEVGIIEDSAFIPTTAFGRQFASGVSQNKATEYSFDYGLGICGSAFAAPLTEVLQNLISVVPQEVYQVIDDIVIQTNSGNTLLCPAQINNFTYQLSNATYASQQMLNWVDAGFDINLPIPAVLRPGRLVDVVIIVDASGDTLNAPELSRSQQYALQHGIKFPPIDYSNITNNLISVFQDPNDMTVPIVVYIPVIKNPSYSDTFDPIVCTQTAFCETENFQYTNAQFDELFGLTNFTVNQEAGTILQALKDAVLRK